MKPTPLGKTYLEYETELKEYNLSKAELASQKVELGVIQDLNKKATDLSNKILNNKAVLSNEFIKVKDLYMSWFRRYNKTEDQAKELGIKLPSDIIKLEKDAIDKSNEARDMGNNLAKLL